MRIKNNFKRMSVSNEILYNIYQSVKHKKLKMLRKNVKYVKKLRDAKMINIIYIFFQEKLKYSVNFNYYYVCYPGGKVFVQ